MKAYEYNDTIYFNEDDVDTAIELREGGDYNNRPVPEHKFEQIWRDEVYEREPNDWEVFKAWCKLEDINPSYYQSVVRYMKEVNK